jgi:tetratricopeptide (TPR) repeat protein
VWLIESALASETRRLATPARGVPITGGHQHTGLIPTINENAEVTAAEQDLIKALASEVESLRKLNPFLVLGVGYEATDADVRAAFGELTKRYHPDRFARYESGELREVAAEIFILIRDAYRRLGDAVTRAQVLQSLGKPAPVPRTVPVRARPTQSVPPPRASPRLSMTPASGVPVATVPVPTVIRPPAPPVAPTTPGMTTQVPLALRPPADTRSGVVRRPTGEPSPVPTQVSAPGGSHGGSHGGSIDRRTATPSQPTTVVSDPAELTALEALVDQGRLDEALAGYRLVGKRNAGDRNARAGVELCEGLLALAARDRLEAAQRFETVLEIDPSNERAARELAEMRRQATNERKGLLSRLMGKKEP